MHHPDAFVAEGLQMILPIVSQLIQPSACQEDQKLALYFACDILDHLGEKGVPHWPVFLEAMLNCITHKEGELRQPACYGTALAARHAAFAPYAEPIAARLGEMISQTRSQKKTKKGKQAQCAADNALSALSQILQSHEQAVA